MKKQIIAMKSHTSSCILHVYYFSISLPAYNTRLMSQLQAMVKCP